MDIGRIRKEAKSKMEKTVEHFRNELAGIRAGKASPNLLDGLKVNYYGVDTPLNQLASVTVQDTRTLAIHPYDKTAIPNIEKAIMEANLGITPQNDGNVIRLVIPPLTEENRKALVKRIRDLAEQARVAIRNIRRDSREELKKQKNEGVPEDLIKNEEEQIQKLTDDFIKRIDELLKAKEEEIMKV